MDIILKKNHRVEHNNRYIGKSLVCARSAGRLHTGRRVAADCQYQPATVEGQPSAGDVQEDRPHDVLQPGRRPPPTTVSSPPPPPPPRRSSPAPILLSFLSCSYFALVPLLSLSCSRSSPVPILLLFLSCPYLALVPLLSLSCSCSSPVPILLLFLSCSYLALVPLLLTLVPLLLSCSRSSPAHPRSSPALALVPLLLLSCSRSSPAPILLSFLSCSYLALVPAFLDPIPLASSLHLIFALLHPAPFVAPVRLDPDPLAPDLLHPVRDPLAPLDSVDAT